MIATMKWIIILCFFIPLCAAQNEDTTILDSTVSDNRDPTTTPSDTAKSASDTAKSAFNESEPFTESDHELSNNLYTEHDDLNATEYSTNDTLPNEDYDNSSIEEEERTFVPPQDPAEFMDYYEELMLKTRERLAEIFEQYMPQLLQMSSSFTLSSNCTFDAIRILFGLRQLKPWAIKSKNCII